MNPTPTPTPADANSRTISKMEIPTSTPPADAGPTGIPVLTEKHAKTSSAILKIVREALKESGAISVVADEDLAMEALNDAGLCQAIALEIEDHERSHVACCLAEKEAESLMRWAKVTAATNVIREQQARLASLEADNAKLREELELAHRLRVSEKQAKIERGNMMMDEQDKVAALQSDNERLRLALKHTPDCIIPDGNPAIARDKLLLFVAAVLASSASPKGAGASAGNNSHKSGRD